MLNKCTFDAVGIGFGPANIALAIYLREIDSDLDIIFLEKNSGPAWQTNMCYPESDIQNHPLRDLVTPRNPKSKFTFTNFLFETGRLYEHLNIGFKFPSRTEYEQYVKWVASHFSDRVRYSSSVDSIDRTVNGNSSLYNVRLTNGSLIHTNKIIAAPGRSPYFPPVFAQKHPRVIHLNDYIKTLNTLFKNSLPGSIAVVGGSQSAVEIILDMSRRYPNCRIDSLHRNFGFRQKDVSPFTGRVFFPSFVQKFYNATAEHKHRLNAHLKTTNYSASDLDILESLYEKMYYQRITDTQTIRIHDETRILRAGYHPDQVTLSMTNPDSEAFSNDYELVILATGFRDIGPGENQEPYPKILDSLSDQLLLDENGSIRVRYDYSVPIKGEHEEHIAPTLYLNGLCESSHGMGDAGSFSLLALRSEIIAKSLLKHALNNTFSSTLELSALTESMNPSRENQYND